MYKGSEGLWPWPKYRYNRIFFETCLPRKHTLKRRPIHA